MNVEPGTRRLSSKIHHGRRPSPIFSVQRLPFARSMNAKSAFGGPTSPASEPSVAHVVHRGVVARQHQVIAVVDDKVSVRVVIRARTSASLLHRLVHDDALAAPAQADRGGKAGEPGADDMNRARHQKIAWRRMVRMRRGLETFTGSRGAFQPRLISLRRIA